MIGYEAISGEARDAEVSAQVEEIERTEGSINNDQVNVGGVGDEQDHSFDIAVREANPEVGGAGVVGHGVGVSGDEVTPAAVEVLRANIGEQLGVIESRLGIFVNVDGDAAQAGDDALGLFVSSEVAGEAEHLAVEGEVGVEGGVAAEGVQAAREPGVVGVSRRIGGGLTGLIAGRRGGRWRVALLLGTDGERGKSEHGH